MSENRTIRNLVEQYGKVYVYLSSTEIAEKFMILAEHEGFTFADGVKPAQKHISDILSVSHDGIISYVGFVGRIALGSGTKKPVCIDFEKYLDGTDNYIA